jgi:aminoglycoside phosphotransferase family enzyme
VADDDTTTSEPGQQLETRVGHLETTQAEQGTKLDAILDKLGHLVPGSHAEAQQRTEDRLDRPASVAEQVRAELARAEQERAEQDAADADKSEREQMREQLAALREKPPVPPMPLRSRILMKGWGD